MSRPSPNDPAEVVFVDALRHRAQGIFELEPEAHADGSLSITVPPGEVPGLVDVRVVSEARQSLLRRAFRYRSELRIDSIDPPLSAIAGGEPVVIRGEGFSTATKISFGDVEGSMRMSMPATARVGMTFTELPASRCVTAIVSRSRAR